MKKQYQRVQAMRSAAGDEAAARSDSTARQTHPSREPTISDVLGDWRTGPGSLHHRLSTALVKAINHGDLPKGSGIPPERVLADILGISRGTVASALKTLRESGHIESRRGSGSRVRESPPAPDRHQEAILSNPFLRTALLPDREMIWFTLAKMPASDEVREAVQTALTGADLDTLLATHGYATVGTPSLREAIARHYTDWGFPTKQQEILVTSGAQQALSLVMADTVASGGPIVIEDPSYSGAVDFLHASDTNPTALPAAADGSHIKHIPRALAERPGGLVYLVTSFHNPTGSVLSDSARRLAADVFESTDALLVEDSSLSHVTLGSPPPLPLSATMRHPNTVVIDSISKVFWGGLRVGWVRSSADVIRRLSRLKSVHDLATSILSQVVGTLLLPQLPDAGRRLEERILPRLELLMGLIDEHLPEWSYVRPDGGFSLWVTIPFGDSEKFTELAMLHGVAVVSGNTFSATATQPRCLRIPFVLDEESIREGVHRLTKAWAEYKGIVRHPRGPNVIV